MNINRLIWTSTTVLFGFIGFLLGLSLGRLYLENFVAFDSVKEPARTFIAATLAIGSLIVLARLGSWLADRYLLNTLSHMKEVSVADRVLGVAGVLSGVLFAVLITFPLPNDPIWLPIKLCAMAICGVFGIALFQGMREEIMHVFPRLEGEATPGTMRSSAKLLDTNIIIDGRMAEICKTGFIEGTLYVPSFVLEEVQHIADSADSLKRARGRRGLDILNQMRELKSADPAHPEQEQPVVQVLSEFPASVRRINSVDSKLVALARETQAAIVTNDFNLNRVAELQGVQVLNINELVHALRPVVLPGEEMVIPIVKEGKEPGQGVGYLDDGTMVVVSDARRSIGKTCPVVITSVIQTVAGKMIFAELKSSEASGSDEAEPMKGSGDDLFEDAEARPKDSHYGNGKNHGSVHRSSGGMRRKSRP